MGIGIDDVFSCFALTGKIDILIFIDVFRTLDYSRMSRFGFWESCFLLNDYFIAGYPVDIYE